MSMKNGRVPLILLSLAVAVAAVLRCPAAPKAEIKIMTYNVRHCRGTDNRLDVARTAALIRAEAPDFACLQEIDRCTARVDGIDEPAELARLTGLHATFAKAIPFRGGEYGVMILSRGKPLAVERIPLPGKEPRVLLICEFKDFVVANSHLSAGSMAARKASVPIIRDAFAKYGKPLFFCGDWNALPRSGVLKALGRFLRVVSDRTGRTCHAGGMTGAKGELLDRSPYCIDYIAVDRKHAGLFTVVDTHVVEDRIASDHAPVVATLAYARKRPSLKK